MSYSNRPPIASQGKRWDEEAQDDCSYDESTGRPVYYRGVHQTQRTAHIPRSRLAARRSDLPSSQYYQDPTGLNESSYSHSRSESGSVAGSANPLGISAQIPHVPPSETWTNTEEGRRVVYARSPHSRVETRLVTSPHDQISDHALAFHGIQIQRTLLPTPGDHELLFPSFKVRDGGFFIVGRVFVILWAEPAGEASVRTILTDVTKVHHPDSGLIQGRYGEYIYSKVRRFVVVRRGSQFCTALPITSYGRQGVGKAGIVKSEHTIIYTGNAPPQPLPTEAPSRGELPMQQNPIRVVVDDVTSDRLDAMSRLHFGQPHTIQHNIKVKPFGMVHPKSMRHLMSQFLLAWSPARGEQELAELTRLWNQAL